MRHFIMALAVVAITAPAAVFAGPQDQKVADQIAKNLRLNDTLRGYEIGVKFRDGTARLEGWVRNQQQLDNALQVAERTPLVVRVINQLSIGAPRQTRPLPTPVQRVSQKTNSRSALRRTNRSRTPSSRRPNLARRNSRNVRQAPQPAVQPRPVYYPQPMPIGYRANGGPLPTHVPGTGGGVHPAVYDQPYMPNYAWPSYAAYPNYAALTYPKQYSPAAWPYIGPFYPYPQVPMGWRKVTLEWDDGWWFLDFNDRH